MSAPGILAAHQWLFDNRYFCICGAAIEYDVAAEQNWTGCISAAPSEQAMSAHQLDVLKSSGYALVKLPKRCAVPQYWDKSCLGGWRADNFGAEPVSAWPNDRKGHPGVALPDGDFISASAARDLAGALLAAANAAEAHS